MSVDLWTSAFLRKMIERAAGEEFLSCPFHALTGIYCPGCGGRRALAALLTGHPAASFLYHPLVVYGAASAVIFLFYYLGCRAKKRTPSPLFGRSVLIIGCVVLAANFLWKNGLLIFCGKDMLKELDALWDQRFNIAWYWL